MNIKSVTYGEKALALIATTSPFHIQLSKGFDQRKSARRRLDNASGIVNEGIGITRHNLMRTGLDARIRRQKKQFLGYELVEGVDLDP